MATRCPQPGWTAGEPTAPSGPLPQPRAQKPLLAGPLHLQPTSPSLSPVMRRSSRLASLSPSSASLRCCTPSLALVSSSTPQRGTEVMLTRMGGGPRPDVSTAGTPLFREEQGHLPPCLVTEAVSLPADRQGRQGPSWGLQGSRGRPVGAGGPAWVENSPAALLSRDFEVDARLARKPCSHQNAPLPALPHWTWPCPAPSRDPPLTCLRPPPAPSPSEQPSIPLQAALGPQPCPACPVGEVTEARMTLFPSV